MHSAHSAHLTCGTRAQRLRNPGSECPSLSHRPATLQAGCASALRRTQPCAGLRQGCTRGAWRAEALPGGGEAGPLVPMAPAAQPDALMHPSTPPLTPPRPVPCCPARAGNLLVPAVMSAAACGQQQAFWHSRLPRISSPGKATQGKGGEQSSLRRCTGVLCGGWPQGFPSSVDAGCVTRCCNTCLGAPTPLLATGAGSHPQNDSPPHPQQQPSSRLTT